MVVAYSGGVDSTFLLKVARDTLKDKVLAVTAISETYPKNERIFAANMTKMLKIPHKFIKTNEFKNARFVSNPENRCYYCKKELFKKLKTLAKKKRYRHIIDASTYDDLKDFRPGRIAREQLGIRSPLEEAYFTKQEVRKFSKGMKLMSWDRPSLACLASRIPYRQTITKKRLAKIDRAEEYLKTLGFKQVRVRDHNNLARIEVDIDKIKMVISKMKPIMQKFKKIGFDYVTVDLEGFRSGSMNVNIKRAT